MLQELILKKVSVHNLKKVSLKLQLGQFIVFTGVSGSGKSSLAFDTIYVEGQRRYIESLSTYARRHLGDMAKPDVELITGISPTIAIEQKTAGRNPRSTVGTMTGIYDFLRLLFARIGIHHCPISQEVVVPRSSAQILLEIQTSMEGEKVVILAPYFKGKKGELKEEFAELLRKGYTRIYLDGKLVELSEKIEVDGRLAHDVDVVVDRIVVKQEEKGRLAEAVTTALEVGGGLLKVLLMPSEKTFLFSKEAYSPSSGISYPPLEPHDFSFNHPSGMCTRCLGLGTVLQFILDKVIDPHLSIAQDCCLVASSYQTIRFGNIYDNLAKMHSFNVNTPWEKLSEKAREVFLYGNDKKWTKMVFYHPVTKKSWIEYVEWRGVLAEAKKRYQEAQSETYRKNMEELMEESVCLECKGARIRPYPAASRLKGATIQQLTRWPIEKTLNFFKEISLTPREKIIAEELVKEVRERLFFLYDVGLHYLTLDRTAPTLSGGESQRVRLASQIGSGLSKAIYVLDEPSIGLHPRDNTKLLSSVRALCDLGNTVIVVEHDEETILAADYIVDVGPLAGAQGGEIVAEGSLEDLLSSKKSITADYLTGKRKIPIPKKRRSKSGKNLLIQGASHHNLKGIDVEIPLEVFITVTGVSGSGKSSLITDILHPLLANKLHHATLKVGKHKGFQGIEEIDKVIAIDQSPIGKIPRSNPGTYIKLFDEIRDLFALLPESVSLGYKGGHFSFNNKEGACLGCSGMGVINIDMDFMEDAWGPCEQCGGRRFNPSVLSILYKGKSIDEVLEMTVEEALSFFEAIPAIRKKLETLKNVGLSYIKIGQSSPTLSGGEAQRIKLAKELSRPSTGKTLYILDEPTTGLHFHDCAKLIELLHALVEKKNTVLVIEHNMDLVKTADWIIDLGPEGGEEGGYVIGLGTPEQIAKQKTPTGRALASALKNTPLERFFKKGENKGPLLEAIEVEQAEQNTLKGIDARIPHGKITVCTGPSGSGKSSFAFETVYAEGQRRYTESMSHYARQFIKQMPKPKVKEIRGLLASIAIEQKSHAGSSRSTIGTMTEIYDYLRLIFAHLGTAYCPETGEAIRSISKEFVREQLMQLKEKTKITILAPLVLKPTELFADVKERYLKEGYLRIRLNGVFYELEEEIPFDKKRKNELMLVVDRLMIHPNVERRLYDALDVAAKIGGNTLIACLEDKDIFYNLAFAAPSTGKSYPPITPQTFSFNTSHGMCFDCMGLGFQYGANLYKHRSIMRLSPLALMKKLWKENVSSFGLRLFFEVLEERGIDPELPLEKLPPSQLHEILAGFPEEVFLEKRGIGVRFEGIGPVFAKLAKSALSSQLKEEMSLWTERIVCPSCEGSRLNPLARRVRIGKTSISDFCALPLDLAYTFMAKLAEEHKGHSFLADPLAEIKHRLEFLCAIGLSYLSLDRAAPTLSGGETQRVRLSRQLGSGLTGCLYVLDEPTIGLHPHNNSLLNLCLKALCEQGNTLLLVEHDPLTLQIADLVLDFGPGAGKQGGEIIARGTVEEITKNKNSLTGAYLSGRKKIPLPKKRRSFTHTLQIEGAKLNNLKNLSLEFPLQVICSLTGVSGCGKSTLLNDLIRPAMQIALASRQKKKSVEYLGTKFYWDFPFEKMLVMDQNPIGTTARADVSTYTDLSTVLRDFFSQLPEAQIRGLKPKNFSSNHLKGMCMGCFGLGKKKIEMQFLPPVQVTCESCHGYRLNPVSLQVKMPDKGAGKHLGEVLELSVEEALSFIGFIPKVSRILETLIAVGLGYLKLGQEVGTLSGGEAQRLRLSRELSKRSTGKTLYLFDEPTIGLHSDDIIKLLKIFHELADQGNSLIIIEHNLDVIASADYIVDLGPEGGEGGGKLVAKGTPEEVARHKTSHTARYLKTFLSNQ